MSDPSILPPLLSTRTSPSVYELLTPLAASVLHNDKVPRLATVRHASRPGNSLVLGGLLVLVG